jgi:hypothetical protein
MQTLWNNATKKLQIYGSQMYLLLRLPASYRDSKSLEDIFVVLTVNP